MAKWNERPLSPESRLSWTPLNHATDCTNQYHTKWVGACPKIFHHICEKYDNGDGDDDHDYDDHGYNHDGDDHDGDDHDGDAHDGDDHDCDDHHGDDHDGDDNQYNILQTFLNHLKYYFEKHP